MLATGSVVVVIVVVLVERTGAHVRGQTRRQIFVVVVVIVVFVVEHRRVVFRLVPDDFCVDQLRELFGWR